MAIANSKVQALVTRIDKLEKQNRRFKQLAFAALILPALLLLALLSSVAAPAQAPTHQASAPEPASAAERISALESKVQALSEKVASLRKSVFVLLATAPLSGSTRDQSAAVAELRDQALVLGNDVRKLQSDVGIVRPGLDVLESEVDSLRKSRDAMCSLFRIGNELDACPAF